MVYKIKNRTEYHSISGFSSVKDARSGPRPAPNAHVALWIDTLPGS